MPGYGGLELALLYLAQMMMADIRRIAHDQVVFRGFGLRWLGLSETTNVQPQPGTLPEVLCRFSVMKIYLVTSGCFDARGRDVTQQCRIVRPGSKTGFEKIYLRRLRQKRVGVRDDLGGQFRRRCELTEPIPFSLGLGAVQPRLKFEASGFACVDDSHFYSPKSARSFIRCSQTQSIDSAASYPR